MIEAAKALAYANMKWVGSEWAHLRAAIAREEAKPANSEQIEGLKISHAAQRDRAQQAEASAAWHKAESERLSAELADARERLEYVEERVKWTRDYLGCREDQACWIAAAAMRDRAEKAEEEIAHVRKALGAADGELTWMAAEKRVNMHHAAVGGCETPAVASHCGALPKFDGDPKACAFPPDAFINAGPSHDLKPFMPGAAAADALIDAVGAFRALSIAADAVAKSLGGKS